MFCGQALLFFTLAMFCGQALLFFTHAVFCSQALLFLKQALFCGQALLLFMLATLGGQTLLFFALAMFDCQALLLFAPALFPLLQLAQQCASRFFNRFALALAFCARPVVSRVVKPLSYFTVTIAVSRFDLHLRRFGADPQNSPCINFFHA
jgi:hypothetical protein